MAVLVFKQSDGTEKVLEAGEQPLVIGRLQESDIPVLDPFISRVHCGIAYRDHQFHLKDLGSANGTYRNGTRVFECTLAPNDRIQVGNTTLFFEITSTGTVMLRQAASPPVAYRATGPVSSQTRPGSRP